MSCKICGRCSCASWMHSGAEQQAYEGLDGMDELQLKSEIVSLKGEIEDLQAEIDRLEGDWYE